MIKLGIMIGWALAILLIFISPLFQELKHAILPTGDQQITIKNKDLLKEYKSLNQAVRNLKKKGASLIPSGYYLIVNTAEGDFFLKFQKNTIRQGLCSTGSYVHLKSSDNRQWVFRTPRGLFRIQDKIEAPIWRMPDWAFLENGIPVPPPNSPERFEAGVLGEYALSLGDGYLIHGTLYKRFLGMPVTHGCVRLDDEDLRSVYINLAVGSKVFIY
ncbi:MAG: L,D-transpeptidase [bacterium]|nr:MAG: L,D-transpeptidase [bacterium]